jgi:hypothetical protein
MLPAGGGAAPRVVITPSGAAALAPGTAVVLPGSVGFIVTDSAGAAYGIVSAFSVGPGGGGGGSGAATTIEWHHQLPTQFADKFKNAGLNIKDFKIPLERGAHRLKPGGLHTGPDNWNAQWQRFFDQYPNAKAPQILDHLARMRKAFGLE